MKNQPTTEIARRGKHRRLFAHSLPSTSQSLQKTVAQLAAEVDEPFGNIGDETKNTDAAIRKRY